MVTVLHLTPRMAMGFGISEVLAALDAPLRSMGVEGVVGCLEHDDHYPDISVRRVRPYAPDVSALVRRVGADVVVAHGSPYFEVLPALGGVRTIAYEYGDPTPAMFPEDGPERARIAEHKREQVYPSVSAVATISAFVRHDIGWPAARVIRLGSDHVPDLGTKPWLPAPEPGPLRVGVLMRLGAGEAAYKGSRHLLDLVTHCRERGLPVRFELMGRGRPQDAEHYRRAGLEVHLNATDAERTEFLRRIDVFVTTSQWEGTNLPLVEAQALGTPSLAFDTGAHPEFTPFVFSSRDAMVAQLAVYARRPDLLADHGAMSYRFVRRHLDWRTTAQQLTTLLRGLPEPPQHPPGMTPGSSLSDRRLIARLRRSLHHHGVAGTARRAGHMMTGRGTPP